MGQQAIEAKQVVVLLIMPRQVGELDDINDISFIIFIVIHTLQNIFYNYKNIITLFISNLT